MFLALVLFVFSGTESERSCSYTASSARESQRKLLRQSVTGSLAKPMKIAAINGKPKVNHRYLGMSRECEFYLILFILILILVSTNFINLLPSLTY